MCLTCSSLEVFKDFPQAPQTIRPGCQLFLQTEGFPQPLSQLPFAAKPTASVLPWWMWTTLYYFHSIFYTLKDHYCISTQPWVIDCSSFCLSSFILLNSDRSSPFPDFPRSPITKTAPPKHSVQTGAAWSSVHHTVYTPWCQHCFSHSGVPQLAQGSFVAHNITPTL